MKAQQYNESLLEAAWDEVEIRIGSSGMIDPPKGFVNRFKLRLETQRLIEQRRQAWIFISINVITAIILLAMIGLLYIPTINSPSDFLIRVTNIFKWFTINIRMAWGVLSSLARTLPDMVPTTWWASILIVISTLSMLWISLIRSDIKREGALV